MWLCKLWDRFRTKEMTNSAPTGPGPTPYTNEVVRRMFIETADQNYASARWAFLNELNVDFFWLGLHALEKYLKAILLMNGQSAKQYSHDIERLFDAVRRLDPALSFGPLSKPVQVAAEAWRDESIESFIKRINEQGDPNRGNKSQHENTKIARLVVGYLFDLYELWVVAGAGFEPATFRL